MMDGPVIQQAGTRALERGVRTRDVFAAVEAVRSTGTPAVVMTYWNLVDRYGVDAFARDLANAGGSGLITPDLIPDEADDWLAASDAHGLDRIFLVSPSSSDERIVSTAAACRGWMYATAVMGVTGTRTASSSAAPGLVARVRALAPETLVGVGLGVSDRRPGRRGHELRRRRHRRVGLRQDPARRRGRRHARRPVRACGPCSPTSRQASDACRDGHHGRVRSVRLVLAGLLALALLAGCAPAATVTVPSASPGYLGAELTTPYQLPDVSLDDQTGKAFNLRTRQHGTGPDLLLRLHQLSRHLPEHAHRPRHRDRIDCPRMSAAACRWSSSRSTRSGTRPPVMAKYLSRIDPGFVGLTGPTATIEQVAASMGVVIEGIDEHHDGAYDVTHSAQVVGFDAARRGVVVWTQGTSDRHLPGRLRAAGSTTGLTAG